MSLRFDITSGARAGQSVLLDKTYATIGRHPSSDLRFDSDHDLTVIARHAAVVCRDHHYFLRDLGSTTGTYVNGTRVIGDRLLSSGDDIEFGHGGPSVRVTMLTVQHALPVRTDEPRNEDSQIPAYLVRPRPSGGVTVEGVERELRRQRMEFRRHLTGATLLALVAVGAAMWQARTAPVAGAISRQAGGAARTGSGVELLERKLRDATARLSPGTRAGTPPAFDLAAIAAANRGAVGLVIARFRSGTAFTGSGFIVQSGGDSALFVTNRHVVTARRGTRLRTVELVFDGSSRIYPAELVAVHPKADLALIRVRGTGLRAVRGLGTGDHAVVEGATVAMLGFPLGLDLPMGGDWRDVGISATSAQGTVSRVLANLIQLDSYGAQGASGSPIFDARGDVVAVLYGGERDSAGHIVYGVPVQFVSELLRTTPR